MHDDYHEAIAGTQQRFLAVDTPLF